MDKRKERLENNTMLDISSEELKKYLLSWREEYYKLRNKSAQIWDNDWLVYQGKIELIDKIIERWCE